MSTETEREPFTFDGDLRDDDTRSETISWETLVYQAVGAASMCWENPGGAGVFDDQRARDIAEAVIGRSGIARTSRHYTSPRPSLGL